MEEGNLMDVRVWLESQEQELGALLGGHPLHEPLFQLMCHPVRTHHKSSSQDTHTKLKQREHIHGKYKTIVIDGPRRWEWGDGWVVFKEGNTGSTAIKM